MIGVPNTFWAHNTFLAMISIIIALVVAPKKDWLTVIMSVFFIWFVVYSVARPESFLFYPAYLFGVVVSYVRGDMQGSLMLFILGAFAIFVITIFEQTPPTCLSNGNGSKDRRYPYVQCVVED